MASQMTQQLFKLQLMLLAMVLFIFLQELTKSLAVWFLPMVYRFKAHQEEPREHELECSQHDPGERRDEERAQLLARDDDLRHARRLTGHRHRRQVFAECLEQAEQHARTANSIYRGTSIDSRKCTEAQKLQIRHTSVTNESNTTISSTIPSCAAFVFEGADTSKLKSNLQGKTLTRNNNIQ